VEVKVGLGVIVDEDVCDGALNDSFVVSITS
jgi:transposase